MMKNSVYPFYFTLGALLLYVVFVVLPGFMGIAYSFTDWNSYTTEVNFIGLENFRTILSASENYLGYIQNTLLFTVWTITLKTIIALFLAVLLNYGVRRFSHLYRVIIYLPVVLPTIAVGLVFRSILNPRSGILNEFLRAVGLGGLAQSWLVNPDIALFSVIGVDTWKGVGYIMVILLAGLQTIPQEYYEAAEIDGATPFARFRHITLPLLVPAITVVSILNLLYGLRVFDIVYVLTGGGPGYATDVVFTAVFDEFSKGRYGLGTALSTVLFVIMTVVGIFIVRRLTRDPIEA
ncbi:MAG: sugar ABC transporter permease [Chloroflexi bacterium]|nr:sugar ABC transporter permease [Chloroflexota bacterium]MBK9747680.1 sugar ABC transporter permease [Chloroflexota bacterium]